MSSRHDKRLNTPVSTANPVSKRKTDLLFSPKTKIGLFNGAKTDRFAATKTARFYPSKNVRKWAVECKTCACFFTSGPPSVPRRGYARGGASVASLRTPQTSTRLSTAKSMDRPAPPLVQSVLRKQSGGAGAALTRLRLPALSVRFLLFV